MHTPLPYFRFLRHPRVAKQKGEGPHVHGRHAFPTTYNLRASKASVPQPSGDRCSLKSVTFCDFYRHQPCTFKGLSYMHTPPTQKTTHKRQLSRSARIQHDRGLHPPVRESGGLRRRGLLV